MHLALVLTAVMDLEFLDDDVADLLGALGVRRLVLVVIELVVRGGRGRGGGAGVSAPQATPKRSPTTTTTMSLARSWGPAAAAAAGCGR